MKKLISMVALLVIMVSCAKDKEKPSIEISQPVNDASVNKNTEISCTFTCNDNKQLHEVSYEVKNTNSGAILTSGKEDIDKKTYTKNFSFTSPNNSGKIEIKIEAEDHSGNKVEKSISINVQS
jgi:hypothetical protein